MNFLVVRVFLRKLGYFEFAKQIGGKNGKLSNFFQFLENLTHVVFKKIEIFLFYPKIFFANSKYPNFLP